MRLLEPKINNESCDVIRNLHTRNNTPKQHFIAIFFDLEKAHEILWYCGWPTQHGIVKQTFKLYKSFFFFRTGNSESVLVQPYQNPKIKKRESLWRVYSVTFFNIKINSISNCLNPGVETVSPLYKCSEERHLQQDIIKINKWTKINGFRISKTKTQCVHFCQLRKCVTTLH